MPARRAAMAAVSALTLGAVLASGVGSASAARDVGDACPAGTPEDGFTDTGPDGSVLEAAVDCLVAYGVTAGVGGRRYDPAAPVRREQMATFLVRMLGTAEGFTAPGASSSARFDDVDPGSTHARAIDTLAALDIALGTAPRRFSPGQAVDRGSMASFLVRVLEQVDADLPVVTFDEFDDDEGSVHEDAINVLAALDIADGESAARFNPRGQVTRQQMAFFLTRTLDLLVEDEGLVTPAGS